jgi:hypothetical protein
MALFAHMRSTLSMVDQQLKKLAAAGTVLVITFRFFHEPPKPPNGDKEPNADVGPSPDHGANPATRPQLAGEAGLTAVAAELGH